MITEKTRRMLVVDDEPDMARGIFRILKLEGYDVHSAASGEEAIVQAKEFQPDGILMDIKMPGIDGVEAYRQIRTICPNAFVIFMTAFSSLVSEAREEGAVEVLTKPLDPLRACRLIAKAMVTRPVLIVDDDENFGESLSRVLKIKGYAVQRASSGAQACKLFEKKPRSFVLLDMRLGDVSGIELLQTLKERNPTAMVIQMSGYSDMEELMKKGMELSATAFFIKPLDLDCLFATMEHALQFPK